MAGAYMNALEKIITSAPAVIVAGHYGAGKTNVAVALALAAKKAGRGVVIADLDIVNPYFRTADAKEMLEAAGVRTLIPEFANSNVDIPALPPTVSALFSSDDMAVVDVGGDDGAVALGVYRAAIKARGYEMLCVVNACRPMTETPEDAVELAREAEALSGLRFTAVVNNSNLGAETTREVIERSEPFALRVAEMLGVPLAFTSYLRSAFDGEPRVEGALLPMDNATKQLF